MQSLIHFCEFGFFAFYETNTMKKITPLIFILATVSSISFAQWQQTNGPYVVPIPNCITSDGTNVFIGTWSGVLLSTNNGSTWTQMNNGLTNIRVESLAISGGNIFAGTGDGVFLSNNNGTSWTAINIGFTNFLVTALAVNGSNIFMGTWIHGVYLSTNNGSSWTAVNTGLTDTVVNALAISGSNIFAGTNGGVFLSTNNGNSWTAVNTGLTNLQVESLAISGTNIFAGTATGGVFLSTNNGSSWSAMNTGLTATWITSLAISGSNIFSGTYSGVFLSTNNGGTWTAVNSGLADVDISSLAVSGTNIFATTYSKKVYLSSNNGGIWNRVSTGSTTNQSSSVCALAIRDTNIFAGTGIDRFNTSVPANGDVALSTTNGNSWSVVNTGLPNIEIMALAISDSNIFAATAAGLFRSTNNGSSWTVSNNGISGYYFTSLAINGANIFTGNLWGNDGVFLSTDNGSSWTPVSNGLTHHSIWSLAVSGTNIFAGTEGGGVFLSTNNGSNWTAVNNGLPDTNVISLAVSGGNVFAGTYSGGVFLSSNNGSTWSAKNNGLTDSTIMSFATIGNNIFAGTYRDGVFLSADTGNTWMPVNTGLTDTIVNTLAISGSNIFAGTLGGLWRRPLSEMILLATIDSIHSVTSCNASDGSIFITPSGGTGSYTYLWSPGGFTTQDISNLSPGSYTVNVADAIGSFASVSQNIYVMPPPTQLSICITTVDSITSSKNILIWEKPITTEIDSFRIYREIASVYTHIGSVPYSTLSTFTDSTNGVDPKISSYLYKISSVDTNGVEGALSNAHETMFLQVTQPNPPAFDLTWTDYCGFPVAIYYIYRDSIHNNSWEKIDSAYWGTNVFTDSFPPNDSARYRIEAFPPTSCTATIKNPIPLATTVKGSKSNSQEKLANPVSVAEISSDNWLKVYPNPSNGKFTVAVASGSQYTAEVYNIFGEKIFGKTVNHRQDINLSEANGIYFLRIHTENGVANRKIVISR